MIPWTQFVDDLACSFSKFFDINLHPHPYRHCFGGSSPVRLRRGEREEAGYAGLPANPVPDRDRPRTGPNPRHSSWVHASISYILIPFGQVLAAKTWKSNQIWLIQTISIRYFWSSGLVTLITFGRVLAAKDWKSNQIWLIQFISISIILIFWFGDFDSFLTGFGCQRLKKQSTLADSIHFNSIILIFWFGDFDYFRTGFGCQRLKK